MEAIIFMGVQGSGKSSFFKERFFLTHVHINLDVLKTRNRERRILEVCLDTGQRFVVDNTNSTKADRSRYISPAKAAKFEVVGYKFESKVEDCRRRNSERIGRERVPDVAIYSTAAKLELPTRPEGFDRLFQVRLENGQFVVDEWSDESCGA